MTLLALGFANLAMLGWLAAASVPILIHLWNRRRYREVSWAAVEFLLAAVRKNSRRLLIEQWLLLALRTLLIVLLVLAVAEPFWEAHAARFAAGAPAHRVLVIDGSLSMLYRPTEQSRFDRAKELALQIVDQSGPGDGFTVVLLADPPQAVVASPAFDPSDVRAEIEALQPTHGRALLPAGLAMAEDLVRRAQSDFPRLQQIEVCLFSDLDRATWGAGQKQAEAELRERAGSLAKLAALTVIDVGQDRAENAAVTGLRVGDPLVVANQDVTFEAELRNFGHQARPGQAVELIVGGSQAAVQQVDLEPQGRASVAFHHQFDRAGPQAAEVRLADDLLQPDNHRFLALDVKDSLRVLCVDGRFGARPRGAAAYLSVALAPQAPPARNLLRPDVEPETALVEVDLSAYDAVFLCDVAQFTPNEARLLTDYLHSGGGVVLFPGPQSQLDNYNEQLGPLLPGRLGEVSAEGQYALDPRKYEHPLLAAFRDNPRSGLTTAPVSRYVRLTELQDDAQRVADFTSGDPAIVERPVGRGRLIVVATTADTQWTVLPMLPAYLPLVQELAARAVGSQFHDRNLLVGQPLAPASRRLARESVEIERPDGRKDTLRPAGEATTWEYDDTEISGLYQARSTTTADADVFAVSVDPAESDLTRLDPAALREEVWRGVPHVVSAKWEQLDAPANVDLPRNAGLSQSLLCVVAGLLLGELGLAWYFGNRGA